jgi:translocator protein
MFDWYAQLNRPPLSPPNWIFGPVWTILYIMILISLIIYIRKSYSKPSFLVYGVVALHIISNLIWTPLFFQFRNPGLALLDIIFLDITLAYMIFIFWKNSKISSILLWPYMLWVSFATYLNTGFFLLNRN